jgi:hypothetical protein
MLAKRMDLLRETTTTALLDLCTRVGRMLTALRKAL